MTGKDRDKRNNKGRGKGDSNDERNFERWLQGDDPISRTYHDGDQPGPTPELDARILAQAVAATAPVEQPPKRPAWMMPVALAATLLVGVNLAVLVRDNTPDPSVEAPIMMDSAAMESRTVEATTTAANNTVASTLDDEAEAAFEESERDMALKKSTSESRLKRGLQSDDASTYSRAHTLNDALKQAAQRKDTQDLVATDQPPSKSAASLEAMKRPESQQFALRDLDAESEQRQNQEHAVRERLAKSKLEAQLRTERLNAIAAGSRNQQPEQSDKALDQASAPSEPVIEEILVEGEPAPAPPPRLAVTAANESDAALLGMAMENSTSAEDGFASAKPTMETAAASATVALPPTYICALDDFQITPEEIDQARYAALNQTPPRTTLSWRAHIRDLVAKDDYRNACLELAAHEAMFPNTVFLDDFPVRLAPADRP